MWAMLAFLCVLRAANKKQESTALSSKAGSSLTLLAALLVGLIGVGTAAHADDGQSGAGSGSDPNAATTLDSITVFGSGIDHINQDIGNWVGFNNMVVRDPILFEENWGDLSLTSGINPSSDLPTCGNPIIPSTGNKVEHELDFRSHDLEMPLYLERTYTNSYRITGADHNPLPIFLNGWLTNFDFNLYQVQADTTYMIAARPDGRAIKFITEAGDPNAWNVDILWREDKAQSIAYLTTRYDGTNTTATLRTEDNTVETYINSVIQTIRNEHGIGWDFSWDWYFDGHYPRKRLLRVTHTSGRYIEFNYNGLYVVSVRDPAGNMYYYSRDAALPGMLGKVTYPDSTVVEYIYGNAPPGGDDGAIVWYYGGLLVGKSINGVRYSSFAYDKYLRAISTEHAGGVDRHSFSYTYAGPEHRITQTVETNPFGKQTTYTYNSEGKPATISGHPSPNCAGTYSSITYDANGNEDIVYDFNGNATDFDYNNKGQLVSKIEGFGTPAARTTQYVWDATWNRLVSETKIGLARTDYVFDGNNRVSSVTVTNLSPHGIANQARRTVYTYTKHTNNLLASVTVDGPLAGSGDAVSYTYNAYGNLTGIQNSKGHIATYSNYNALGLPGRVTGVNGAITDYAYDARGRVLTTKKYVGSAAYTTTNSYDGRGRLARTVAPDNIAINYFYDDADRVVKVTRVKIMYAVESSTSTSQGAQSTPDFEIAPAAICADCDPGDDPPPPPSSTNGAAFASQSVPATMQTGGSYAVSVQMQNSGTTAWSSGSYRLGSQNPQDNYLWGISRVDLPGSIAPGQIGTFNFNVTAPSTAGTYNFQWQMVQEGVQWFGAKSPNISVQVAVPEVPVEYQKFNYNLNSDVTQIESGLSNVSSLAFTDYDELGRIRARRGNYGQNIRYTYDGNGNIKTVTDSLGRTTTLTYDALNRIITSVDAKSGVTEFKYDSGDQLVRVKDPRGLITTYTYDGLGQLWTQTSPDTGTTNFNYNASGQLIAMARADGSGLGYGYDELGRLVWTGTPSEARNYSYDWCQSGAGQLCGISTTGSGESDWTHFGYTPQGQLSVRRDSTYGSDDWTGYTYDGMGRLIGISYPSGVTVDYSYSFGRLSRMTSTVAGTTTTIASNANYQPFGPIRGWTYGNGLVRGYNYDLDGRITGVSAGDAASVKQSLTYQLNANDEITKITNGVEASLTQTYGYDELSRLTSSSSPSASESIAYDASGNRTLYNWLAPIANAVDPNSNRITSDYISGPNSGILYGHDTRGNRQSQSWNGSTATYSYDVFNRLSSVSRTAPSSYSNPGYVMMTYPAGTTSYTINARDQRVGKTGVGGTSRFIYGGQTQLLGESTNGVWSSYLWFGGELVGLVRNNQTYYVHGDHLGRPEIVTDSTKAVVWRAKNFHSERGIVQDSIGGLNLGFPGQYFDAESGLWHNGFRDYDSRLGRYIQSDPIGLTGGLNTYAYARENPVSSFDPDGRQVPYPPPPLVLPPPPPMTLDPSDINSGGALSRPWGNPPVIIWPPRPQPPTTPIVQVPEPLPPPTPKGPGRGCRGMFEACLKGASKCPIGIKQAGYAVCMAAYIACTLSGGDEGDGGPDNSGWGAQ